MTSPVGGAESPESSVPPALPWLAAGSRLRLSAGLLLAIVGAWAVPRIHGSLPPLLYKASWGLGFPRSPDPSSVLPPAFIIGYTLDRLAYVAILMILVGLVCGRSPLRLGLTPFRLRVLGGGLAAGILVMAAQMAVLAALGVLHVADLHPTAADLARFGVAWALGFGLIALWEEIACRGALVVLAGELAGPWVAAAVSAVVFVMLHVGNRGENLQGFVLLALFALVAALSVVRTGAIWWAVAFHFGWDWTMQFPLGAVGSGYRYQGAPTAAVLSGPDWITGGSAGPEGSLLMWIGQLALVGWFAWTLRRRRSGP